MAEGVTFGKLQAALASATNEVTVAAANINFDFTLVKYEAPAEYQPLARHLSLSRKQNAESGSLHITARRLGALFEGSCPHIPDLLRAYGTRASGISNIASANTQSSASNWVFSEYTGIDVTSLWAAATSSKAALPVHLLACMLARMWNASEATSIWSEIVAERRRDITARLNQGDSVPFSSTAAALQQEITRDQLREWDASARSWLRTADAVMALQQKQLLLIIKNITMPVQPKNNTYDNIMAAWTSGLETIENLINGAPHVVRDGSVLVALSAWHIYPDLIVFGGQAHNKTVEMNDELVQPGGVVSLGISDPDDRAPKGVYWSLSLAHHKFYGRPVSKSSQLNADDSRITLLELQQAVLGAILATWKIPVHETDNAINFLSQLISFLPYNATTYDDQWMEMLQSPINQYLKSPEASYPLISLGRRRQGVIHPRQNDIEREFFSLTHMPRLLELTSSVENKIKLLRRLSEKVDGLDKVTALIAYKERGDWHLASVFPLKFRGQKPVLQQHTRVSTRGPQAKRYHCRWTTTNAIGSNDGHLTERTVALPQGFTHSRTELNFSARDEKFEYFFGDADIAAVFVMRQNIETVYALGLQAPSVSHNDVLWCLNHAIISPEDFKRTVYNVKEPVVFTLVLLSIATRIFAPLEREGASISPQVLTAPFGPESLIETRIIKDNRLSGSKDIYQRYNYDVCPRDVITVIAYFELGADIIRNTNLPRILGISVGDSIYVPKSAINDPAAHHADVEYARLLGNIGKPGLSILTCPQVSEVRDVDLSSWRKAPPDFDGAREDNFACTSLHLSFTHWSNPLWNSSSVGQRESEGSHLEAVVSVRDSGSWVADVNLEAALGHGNLRHIEALQTACGHQEPWRTKHPVKALETWDKVLDCPEGILVAKCHNNWVARLALAAVLSEHCQKTARSIVVCPPNVCWQCLDIDYSRNTVYIY
ncbi:hypothetical protein BJ166DRAFT_470165 [Pestalotiopsis sp. NC0098]|nr:hypothetical protein BJ166DRAFT_470165 [Pestalotiopsis sp. NC0098]